MEVPSVNSYEIFHLTLALNKAPRNAMAFAYKDETCVLLFPGRKERSIFSNTFFNEKQPDCYSNVSADKKIASQSSYLRKHESQTDHSARLVEGKVEIIVYLISSA